MKRQKSYVFGAAPLPDDLARTVAQDQNALEQTGRRKLLPRQRGAAHRTIEAAKQELRRLREQREAETGELIVPEEPTLKLSGESA